MDSAQDGQVVLIAECQAQRLDFLRGAVRKIGYGAIFDLIPLAIGPTQEDTAIHRTVGAQAGGFDNIHSNYYNKGKSKEIQEGASKSSDYITRLLMAHNLQVFKGLDRRMGGGHPMETQGHPQLFDFGPQRRIVRVVPVASVDRVRPHKHGFEPQVVYHTAGLVYG